MPAHQFEPTKEILKTAKSATWNYKKRRWSQARFLRNLVGINNLTHKTAVVLLTQFCKQTLVLSADLKSSEIE